MESRARRIAEQAGLLLQASLLLRHSPVGPAFVAARLAGDRGLTLGALPSAVDPSPLLDRALS